MGRLSRWRHRVGLHQTADKLAWLLARFRFATVSQYLKDSAGDAVQTYSYGGRL
jgi:hypothetical protein